MEEKLLAGAFVDGPGKRGVVVTSWLARDARNIAPSVADVTATLGTELLLLFSALPSSMLDVAAPVNSITVAVMLVPRAALDVSTMVLAPVVLTFCRYAICVLRLEPVFREIDPTSVMLLSLVTVMLEIVTVVVLEAVNANTSALPAVTLSGRTSVIVEPLPVARTHCLMRTEVDAIADS
jgi:hypothetical protein